MARRVVVTIGLLAVSSGLLIGAPSWAQVSSSPQSCSSIPVPNAKLVANVDRRSQKSDGNSDISRKVIVERIEFDRSIHLSDSDVEQVRSAANQNRWSTDSSTWTDELSESLQKAWLNQGYLKVVLTMPVQAHSLGGDSSEERFLVSVHVVDEGHQYHFGDLRFTGGTAIPETELQQVFPLRGGEIFDQSKAMAGISAIIKLYGSLGYIDFTATPTSEFNEDQQRVSLELNLDEEKQYRVGRVEIRGLNPSLEARLRSIVVPGEFFNPQPLETFFKENRPILPSRGLDNFQIRRNVRAGIVDLTFDPRFCRDSE